MLVKGAVPFARRLGHAMVAKPSQAVRHAFVARCHRASVAGGEILCRIKREDHGVAQVPRAHPVALHLDAVGRVLDEKEPPLIGDRVLERAHVGELAVEMDRQNADGACADRRAHRRRVNQARGRLDVDELRDGSEMHDRVRRRGERHRRRDDLVARTYVERSQCEQKPHRAGIGTDDTRRRRVPSADEKRPELLLEGRHLGPEREKERVSNT